jgi:hypothetical protein
LLEQRNLHYWLAPLPLPAALRDCIGLVRDRRLPADGAGLGTPAFDVQQALLSIERYAMVASASGN